MKIVWSTGAIESLVAHFDIGARFYTERFSDTGLGISTEAVIIEQYTFLSRSRRDEIYDGVLSRLSQDPLIGYEQAGIYCSISMKIGNYRIKTLFYIEEEHIHIEELTIWKK